MRREAEMQAQVEQLQDALRVARGEAPKHPVFGKVTTNMRCGPWGQERVVAGNSVRSSSVHQSKVGRGEG